MIFFLLLFSTCMNGAEITATTAEITTFQEKLKVLREDGLLAKVTTL
jgi:hypothetical protein